MFFFKLKNMIELICFTSNNDNGNFKKIDLGVDCWCVYYRNDETEASTEKITDHIRSG